MERKNVFFFDKLNAVIQNEKHFFKSIMRDNGWATPFPASSITKIKLSAANKQAIFENFTFKRPSTEMKNTHLIKSAYNVFFNKIVIESSVDCQKNWRYDCKHEWFGLFYTFATQYLKQEVVSIAPCDPPATEELTNLIVANDAQDARLMRIKAKKDARLMRIKAKEDAELKRIKAVEDGKIEKIQNDEAREKMKELKQREKLAKKQITCTMCKTHTCITCRSKIQALCKI